MPRSTSSQSNTKTLEFYRILGLDIPAPKNESPGALHSPAKGNEGVEFAIDNPTLASFYHAGWRASDVNCSVLMTASVESRQAVDATYAKLVAAGYVARQPPYDAFWGARYAIVADPEGNDAGIMSPVSKKFQSWPPVNSPKP